MPRTAPLPAAPPRQSSRLPSKPRTTSAPPSYRGYPRPSLPARHNKRNPRVAAALCYAFPILPALFTLFWERRNRFVRFHAVQSLLFFLLLAGIQVALFAALLAAGERITEHGGAINHLAVTAGLVYYALVAITGLLGLALWLRFLADAYDGRGSHFPLLSRVAWHLMRLLTQSPQ